MIREQEIIRDHIELKASEAILQDPLCAADKLTEFEAYLIGYHGVNNPDRQPGLAEKNTLRDLRRCVQRVFAHRTGSVLLPVALDLLDGDSEVLDQLEAQATFASDEWGGARYRVFEDDEARIGAGFEAMATPLVNDGLLSCFTPGQRLALIEANKKVTERYKFWGELVRVSAFEDGPVKDLIAREPYVGFDKDSDVSERLRGFSFVAGQNGSSRVNNSLRSDAMDQLRATVIGLSEFYSSVCGAMLPYTFKGDGCPPELWYSTQLENLAAVSAVAAVKDETIERIVYSDRDKRAFRAIQKSNENWVIEATREPLKTASEKIQRAAARNIGRTGLTSDLMGQIGRCPSNQALEAGKAEEAMHDQLPAKIDEITGGRCPEHLRTTITPGDVCAITGISFVANLRKRGIVRLGPSDLRPVVHRYPPGLLEELRQAEAEQERLANQ